MKALILAKLERAQAQVNYIEKLRKGLSVEALQAGIFLTDLARAEARVALCHELLQELEK